MVSSGIPLLNLDIRQMNCQELSSNTNTKCLKCKCKGKSQNKKLCMHDVGHFDFGSYMEVEYICKTNLLH